MSYKRNKGLFLDAEISVYLSVLSIYLLVFFRGRRFRMCFPLVCKHGTAAEMRCLDLEPCLFTCDILAWCNKR